MIGQIGDESWRRVGREPFGNAFNFLVQLEVENGKPRNLMINAGALIVSDVLLTRFRDAKQTVLDYMHKSKPDTATWKTSRQMCWISGDDLVGTARPKRVSSIWRWVSSRDGTLLPNS